jgi:hypothetical protein
MIPEFAARALVRRAATLQIMVGLIHTCIGFAVAVAPFMIFLLQAGEGFGLSKAQLGTLFSLAYLIGAGNALGDEYGLPRPIAIGLTLVVLGILAATTGIVSLVIARPVFARRVLMFSSIFTLPAVPLGFICGLSTLLMLTVPGLGKSIAARAAVEAAAASKRNRTLRNLRDALAAAITCLAAYVIWRAVR